MVGLSDGIFFTVEMTDGRVDRLLGLADADDRVGR